MLIYILCTIFLILLVRHLFWKRCGGCESLWTIYSGYRYWKNYFRIKTWLTLTEEPDGPSPHVYKNQGNSLQDLGLLPHESDILLEEPRDLTNLSSEVQDEVLFTGVNNNTHFVVKIGRRKDQFSEVWLLIALNDGSVLKLPCHPDTRVQSSKDDAFECRGLKLICLSAMRRWKISFNGILKMESEEPKTKHVKFSLIFTAMFNPWANKNLKDSALLSAQLAKIGWKNTAKNFSSLESDFAGFEQWGMINGTIQIDGHEEMELNYWGVKIRNTGTCKPENSYGTSKLYGYLEDGKFFRITNRAVDGKNSIKHGYIVLPAFQSNQVTWNFLPKSSSVDLVTHSKIHIKSDQTCYEVQITKNSFETSFCCGEGSMIRLRIFDIFMSGEEGWGVELFYEPNCTIKLPSLSLTPVLKPTSERIGPDVLDLEHKLSHSSLLTGGKGSSLALLNKLSKTTKNFAVPKGFIVTTTAYHKHLSINAALQKRITKLEEAAGQKHLGPLKELCDGISLAFKHGTMQNSLKRQIQEHIDRLSMEPNKLTLLAVRSSAIGEDGEELSSAGQMDTFLGVCGLDQVIKAIQKCWASQFKFTALQYKRQYGQELNPGMAVVVQKMVSAEVAGVMFTQDPITGNPENISITANYGLGESVVSATAEPDTYVWSKSKEKVLQKEIGEKKIQIRLNENGGTEETSVEDNERCAPCLSDVQIKSLALLGKEVEEAFGNPRDLEWAFHNGEIFLLQSRPVTSLDMENEYELTHELDSPIPTKHDISTKANVGEVCPGAVTPLTISVQITMLDVAFLNDLYKKAMVRGMEQCPYGGFLLKTSYNQLNLNVLNTMFLMNSAKEDKIKSQLQDLNLYGHKVGNKEYRKRGIQRFGIASNFKPMEMLFRIIWSTYGLKKDIKRVESNFRKLNFNPEGFVKAQDLYNELTKKMAFLFQTCSIHGAASSYSSVMNILTMSTMVGNKEEYIAQATSDMANLLGKCGDLVSADVPQCLEELADIIREENRWEEFVSLSPEKANEWLKNNQSIVGIKFRQFLDCHGHRCPKEFDYYAITWGMNSVEVVRTIQSMKGETKPIQKNFAESKSIKCLIDEVKTPLTDMQKRILRFLIPRLKSSVAKRETTKSLLVRSVHTFRLAFRKLGKLMLHEGRLPDEDLIFFLTMEEIGKLLKTRSPHLVSKAHRRMKLHPKLDSLQMEEFMEGRPKPIDDAEENDLLNLNGNMASVTGTPMCQGTIKGTARVITKLEDAASIQQGEILITKATDIGWSPYFPLLSGIVTELGGVISHGAVVAREYGLPCIIGAKGATKIFKSGDQVYLDSGKGILTKIE